ncbi:hypothetical protein [Auritidibacter ignavus]|uniref:hypothetical protein n=1 Tax=Auritidibacter ignavus TaxID=678932 RepID=UPI00109C99B0|nr:hypothetical protein [Auritidibacter ignavus]
MINKVLTLGVGVALGWVGHTLISKGRDEAVMRAEESLRTTLSPENIGRQAGSATATVVSEGAKAFFSQLREEVPAFRSQDEHDQPATTDSTARQTLRAQQKTTIQGTATVNTPNRQDRS